MAHAQKQISDFLFGYLTTVTSSNIYMRTETAWSVHKKGLWPALCYFCNSGREFSVRLAGKLALHMVWYINPFNVGEKRQCELQNVFFFQNRSNLWLFQNISKIDLDPKKRNYCQQKDFTEGMEPKQWSIKQLIVCWGSSTSPFWLYVIAVQLRVLQIGGNGERVVCIRTNYYLIFWWVL